MDETKSRILEILKNKREAQEQEQAQEKSITIELELPEGVVKRIQEQCKKLNKDENELVSFYLDGDLPQLPLDNWTCEEHTAYHEAGHAVIMFAQGEKIEYVSIEREGDVFGCVQGEGLILEGLGSKYFEEGSDVVEQFIKYYNDQTGGDYSNVPLATNEDLIKIKKAVVSYYAGGIAEQIHTDNDSRVGTGSDDLKSNLAIGTLFDDGFISREFGAFIDFLYAQAENYVYMNWESIEIVAEELLKKKRISREELKALIGDLVKRKLII
jgi:hypothetical protein